MYRNKKDVDKYVEKLSAQFTPKEFQRRALSIARLYFGLGDYVNCQKYVEQYLTQKDNNAEAYKLLGQAYQKLGQKDKALEQFETSFNIDPAQTSTIRDICELLVDDDITIKSAQAKYWCEKAEATFPKHPITFRLREKLVSMSNPDPKALINLLTAELSTSPKDPALHIRLLKHYINVNEIDKAFEHCCNVEFSNDHFTNNISWYEVLDEVLKHYSKHAKTWLYQLLILTVKERLCLLSLSVTPDGGSKNLIQTSDFLYDYDQALESVAKTGPENGFAEFHIGLLQHHRGQFCLHVATCLLKKAKKDQLNWREATKIASSFMLIAWQTVPLDVKVNWLKLAPEKQLSAVRRWYTEGSYRCSQSGHFLISNHQERGQQFLDQVSQCCSGTHWKDKLYKTIFTNETKWDKMNSSFIMSSSFVPPILRLPRKTEVEAYDTDAQRLYGNSLHHFVWMLLNYSNYATFECSLFDMLKPTTASNGPETLNKYDVYAFLFCATLTAEQQKLDESSYMASDKANILPANITDLLCTASQMKWWDCAYKFSQNVLGTELTDIGVTLSRGIEVVRCIDNHNLDPVLLCTLGRLFSEFAKSKTLFDEKTYVEVRATLYFKSAIPVLEKLKNKIMIKINDKRMFDYTHKELGTKELNSLLDESKLYVAVNLLKDNENDKAINMLTSVKTPQAYYHLAESYKKIALEDQNSSCGPNSKYVSLLTEAKKYAYKALDNLKETDTFKTNPLYSDTQELVEDIEIHINKVDPDLSGNHYIDDNLSYRTEDTRLKTGLFGNVSSTPKAKQNPNNTNYRTAIDSQILEITRMDQHHLERIENEIKSLQKRDSTMTDFMDQTKVWFMDQTKIWFEENRKLGNLINQSISSIHSDIQNTTDQFKLLKISVDQVKDQIDECRNECKDVGDLKKQIAELKKEVNKLKKTSETVDEADLYNLDEEYRNSENTTNYAAHLPFASQMMPPFNQRPPFPIPPNPYHLYNPNLYNLYNQYTQFAQSSSVPGASQLFDAARAQLNYPGVFPTPDQMYLDVAHLIPPTVPAAPTIPAVTAVPAMPVITNLNVVSTLAPSKPVQTIATSSAPFKTTTLTDSFKDIAKSLPGNVVITSSDPLPTVVSAPVPVLSVTIPQKHIKGTPHNYQITMPVTNESKVSPPVFSFTMPDNKSNAATSNASMWAQPFQTNTEASYKLQFPVYGQNTSQESRTVVDGPFSGSPNTSLNKSRTLSEKSNTSIENYDPCPDFKPIVPLPAEVKVTTGEEDETSLFSSRAKLYRFVNKEWKERGLGEMKLLKHNATGKVRVLMRREQVHKICANHIITTDMEINQMMNETKAYIWVANDFADETFTLETFCIRFKTAEIAKSFYDAFMKARSEATSANSSLTEVKPNQEDKKEKIPAKSDVITKETQSTVSTQGKTVVGGFTFSSTPIFKPVENTEKKEEIIKPETTKSNVFTGISFKTNTSTPFSGFTFNTATTTSTITAPKTEVKKEDTNVKLNTSDAVEEFEPTAEFKPVVPLPALVDQKTGEEEESTLFEYRAKLLRFDSNTKEWKERGLGNIKLLIHKDNKQKVRLLMRREQIMKVCCNHSITKDMIFQKMPNMDKAVTWCAKDFSEGDLVTETFCLRFKTVQTCNDFMEAIKQAQSNMTDATQAAKEQNVAKSSEPTKASGWGDKFKPKPGSWECQSCFVRNESQNDKCSACNSSKDGTSKPTAAEKQPANMPKFSFGIPNQSAVAPPQKTVAPVQKPDTTSKTGTTGFGDKFKPKEGSWECKQCFVRNDGVSDNCCACNSPKDPNAPKEKANTVFGNTSAVKFKFGIPPAPTNEQPKPVPSMFDGSGSQNFSFGIPANTPAKVSDDAANEQKYTAVLFAAPKAAPIEGPLNFSLKNNAEPVKKEQESTPQKSSQADASGIFGSKDNGSFGFVFKPTTTSKSPGKSPRAQGEDDDDGDDYVKEEDCHAHFNPVIPMPDKVEVVTGEENETELFSHRARLYRFVSGEWKERGTGVIRILQHNDTNKLRVVMRREQILKICLNHALTSDITYKPKDEKTWLFAANDFSEGELNLQHFCIRFGNKETATQFKEAVDNSLQGLPVNIVKSVESKTDSRKSTDDEDVVFVSETQASAEEKQQAKDLMLPENFYTYKNKDPCQGCRGCDDDDVKPVTSASQSVSTPLAATGQASAAFSSPDKQTPISNVTSPTTSLYGTPGRSEKTFDNSIFRTPLGSLGSNTQSLTPTNNSNDTSGVDTTNKENVFTQKFNLFSNFGEQKSIFGTPQGTSTSLFGGASQADTPVTTKSSVLAPPKLTTPNTSIDKPETKPSLLSNPTKPVSTTTESIFGSSKPTFGNAFSKDTAAKSESPSMFSGDSTSKTGLFGNTQSSIFGSGNTSGSIFGANKTQGSIFGAGNKTQESIFGTGNKTQESIFGTGNKTQDSIFGSGKKAPENIFTTGALNNSNSKPFEKPMFGSSSIENSDILFKTKSNQEEPFSSDVGDTTALFSSLATKVPGFQKKSDFQWEGAGQQLFGAKAKQGEGNKSGAADESGAGDDEYDPHYEPIVPLPDKITVTTGEEDETKLFAERSKLFRYDEKTKMWKERGVGEMKILYHPERNTYRLLLRREQVFKAVLNMLVYMDLELLPMKNSDRAWTWFGKNYAEVPEGEQEMLAVRFKTIELANKFRDEVVQCVRKLQAAAAQAIAQEKKEEAKPAAIAPLRLPKHLADSARADSILSAAAAQQTQAEPDSNNGEESRDKLVQFREPEEEYDEDDDYEHGYEDQHDYDGYDYNEDDDENGAFYSCEGEAIVKQGAAETTCSSAHIQVLFDQEIYSPKILITDSNTGEILADMLIHTDTEFQMCGDSCKWTGMDYTTNEPMDKTITVNFYDTETAMQFYDSCETSKAATYTSNDPES